MLFSNDIPPFQFFLPFLFFCCCHSKNDFENYSKNVFDESLNSPHEISLDMSNLSSTELTSYPLYSPLITKRSLNSTQLKRETVMGSEESPLISGLMEGHERNDNSNVIQFINVCCEPVLRNVR
jgi:hypothetical protein